MSPDRFRAIWQSEPCSLRSRLCAAIALSWVGSLPSSYSASSFPLPRGVRAARAKFELQDDSADELGAELATCMIRAMQREGATDARILREYERCGFVDDRG